MGRKTQANQTNGRASSRAPSMQAPPLDLLLSVLVRLYLVEPKDVFARVRLRWESEIRTHDTSCGDS